MKRAFRFRLARVQRVRAVFEEEARASFGAAEERALEAEARADARRAHLEAARAETAQARGAGELDPAGELCAEVAEARLRGVLAAERRQAQALRFQAEEQRRRWLDRRADRAGLDRLEERGRDEHREALLAAETAELDETASQRAAARSADPADAHPADQEAVSPRPGNEPTSPAEPDSGPGPSPVDHKSPSAILRHGPRPEDPA